MLMATDLPPHQASQEGERDRFVVRELPRAGVTDYFLPSPPTEKTVHLCVDMQRIFSAEGPWTTPWMERVLPVVVEIARRHPERTVFTRFITPERPQDMPGMWQHYYRRWEETTRERTNPCLLVLLPELARFCPPAVPSRYWARRAWSLRPLTHASPRESGSSGRNLLHSFRECDRMVKRALPNPVPIVNTPQCVTSVMNGTSLSPCTTASLCSTTMD